MDLSQRVRAIISFVQAAESASFAAASRTLGISAAAVSKNVAGLEHVLGIRLFNRTTRTLNLTEEGIAFLQQAKIAIDALDSVADRLSSQKSEIAGHIRISTSAAFGRNQLIPAIPELMEKYPGLSIEADYDDRVIDMVKEGYDIAIRGGRIADSALISRPICNLNMVLVASPEYLQKMGSPANKEDLKAHKLIVRRFLGGKISPWNFKDGDGGISTLEIVTPVMTLSAPEALVDAANLGLGIAQVGVHHAWPYLVSGKLNVVLYGLHDPGNYEMVMVYPHRVLIAPRVRVTIDFLLSKFAVDPVLHVPFNELESYQ
jgi:DNA-binding transcriptional LysR family regulator